MLGNIVLYYFAIGASMAVLIQLYELISNRKEYEGPFGENMLVTIAVVLIWPLGLAMEVYKLLDRLNSARYGKTWYNPNLGGWDFPSNKTHY